MKTRLGIAICGLILSTAGAQAQTKNCEVPFFQTADNQTVDGKMTVRTGKVCSVAMGMSVSGFADPQILKEPKRGSVTIRGYRIIYTPRKSYVGRDQFTYARNSVDRYGNKALRTVNMTVDVTP
jgi:hypothetical protein